MIDSIDKWSTHQPLLAACVMETDGPVLELGCGYYSTFLLHILCVNRKLVSVEVDCDWASKFLCLESSNHKFCNPLSYNDSQFRDSIDEKWDVVFVDTIKENRKSLVQFLGEKAQLIVCHDTEHSVYRWNRVLPKFKYRYDFTFYSVPQTSVVSNFCDLSFLKKYFNE